jgi:hypothetical protein
MADLTKRERFVLGTLDSSSRDLHDTRAGLSLLGW